MLFEELNVNGHKVLFKNTQNGICSVQCIFNAGSIDETVEGTAHFLEHMLFKGTPRFNKDQFNRITTKYGQINAWTSFDLTCYHYDFISRNLSNAFDIFFDMIFNATLPEEEIEIERGVILEEFEHYKNNPSLYFRERITHEFVGKDGHGILGTRNSISSITLKDLQTFVDSYYRNNMIIVVVGNIGKNFLISELEKYLPKTDAKNISIRSNKPNYNRQNLSFHHPSSQACLGIISPGSLIIDSPSIEYAREIFDSGFGGDMHSLLFQEVREKGYCYSIWSNFVDCTNFGFEFINCKIDPENIDKTKEIILSLIQKVKNEGFDSELLELSKNHVLFTIIDSIEKSSNLARIGAEYFKRNGKIEDINEYQQKILNITNDDIIQYANTLFNDEPSIYTMTEGPMED